MSGSEEDTLRLEEDTAFESSPNKSSLDKSFSPKQATDASSSIGTKKGVEIEVVKEKASPGKISGENPIDVFFRPPVLSMYQVSLINKNPQSIPQIEFWNGWKLRLNKSLSTHKDFDFSKIADDGNMVSVYCWCYLSCCS